MKERPPAPPGLDAGRFRLPLIALIRKLLARKPAGALIVDAPGVVRGVGGAELLVEIIATAKIDLVLALSRDGQGLPLANELQACQAEVVPLAANRAAARGSVKPPSQFIASSIGTSIVPI